MRIDVNCCASFDREQLALDLANAMKPESLFINHRAWLDRPPAHTHDHRRIPPTPDTHSMCQVMQSLQGNSLLTTLGQAAQVVSAAQTAATTAHGLGALASLLTGSGSGDQSKSMMSQLISGLSALNGNGNSNNNQNLAGTPGETSTSNFSPLLAVLDYLASNEKSPVSQLLPARRKKPFDLEELASEAAAAMAVNKVPPTPCPSIEEYIAPVFARNYQGVWYVT